MKKSRLQIKSELMGRYEEIVEKVLNWQEAHPQLTLSEVEEFVLELRDEVGVEIAEAVLGQLEHKQMVEVGSCKTCGGKLVYKGQEDKYVETRLGGVEIERGRYWCPHCRKGIFPPG